MMKKHTIKFYNSKDEEVKDVKDVFDGYVVGDVWDSSNSGDSSYPDGYSGEMITMNFPISCVRKIS